MTIGKDWHIGGHVQTSTALAVGDELAIHASWIEGLEDAPLVESAVWADSTRSWTRCEDP
jgi:UDP-3-O-[3-hydroxymyristoyl] glucosamine N-acyltransferase